jgi:hypothetical protein
MILHCDIIKLADESELIVHWAPAPIVKWRVVELYHELPMERDHNGVALAGMLVDMGSLIPALTLRAPPFQDLWSAIDEKVKNHKCRED